MKQVKSILREIVPIKQAAGEKKDKSITFFIELSPKR